ncbi:hypothetical protein [Thalassospira xiamenensis]|uniref:Uncharacterized protein n=1 Tax=Thalassospira xiamenensis TaxID=220697 RepID=A0A367WSI1_9PROT|nr:hypothetical protein [Thalassospira xiamenensis]KZB50778.1 hypothetical protein AUP41_09705 [Thalassospira xiamenensis]RCK44403.1 hypothetical protein TH44_22595 [Thalassospira xiamenensis]
MKWPIGDDLKIWWPVVSVLLAAVFVIVSGIWGADFVVGNADAFSNAVRSLQWETMTAGLFGLAGGCLVLVATRQQIQHVKRHAIEQVVDQELSPYFQIEADIRYLLEDFKNIVDATQTWQETVDYDWNLYGSKRVSFIIILNKRMYKMFHDESMPLVIRKEIELLRMLIISLQDKKNNLLDIAENEIVSEILLAVGDFHEVILKHRQRLIRVRFPEL